MDPNQQQQYVAQPGASHLVYPHQARPQLAYTTTQFTASPAYQSLRAPVQYAAVSTAQPTVSYVPASVPMLQQQQVYMQPQPVRPPMFDMYAQQAQHAMQARLAQQQQLQQQRLALAAQQQQQVVHSQQQLQHVMLARSQPLQQHMMAAVSAPQHAPPYMVHPQQQMQQQQAQRMAMMQQQQQQQLIHQQQQPRMFTSHNPQQHAYKRMRYAAVLPQALLASRVHQGGALAQRRQQRQPTVHAVPAYLTKFYEVIGKIGEGTYGVVYLARSKTAPSDRLLAVKTFKTGREGDGVSLTAIREIMLLRELRHDHIVRLDSVHINRQDPCLSLAFDYAEHDLYEMIRYHREKLYSAPLHVYTIKSILWQLLKGLAYLHQNWILHRDLKPSNLLVMGPGPEEGYVKVADFGLARVFRDPLRALSDNGVVVTIWYRAPELLLGAKHYTPAIDMWAAGCILAELLMLRPLFQGEEVKQPGNAFQADQWDRITRVLGPPTVQMWPLLEVLPHWESNTDNVRHRTPANTPDQLETHIMSHCRVKGLDVHSKLLHLLRQLLQYDPEKRLTAKQALEHVVFSEEPVPGANVFKYQNSAVANYPQRTHVPPRASNSTTQTDTATGNNNGQKQQQEGGPVGHGSSGGTGAGGAGGNNEGGGAAAPAGGVGTTRAHTQQASLSPRPLGVSATGVGSGAPRQQGGGGAAVDPAGRRARAGQQNKRKGEGWGPGFR